MEYLSTIFSLGVMVTLISDIFRILSFFLDGIIYSLIPVVYSLIYSLYDFSAIFDEGVLAGIVNNMTATIYSFLAIFMFFRIAFSLITMLVDPSIIDDKEKGAKKIVLNVMICLILIVIVPKVFDYAKQIQSTAMSEHWIEQIIIGEDFGEDESYDLGSEFSLAVWGVFFRPAVSDDPAVDAYNAVFKSGTGSTAWPLTDLLAELNNVSGDGIIDQVIGIFTGETHYCLAYIYILSTIAGVYVLWMFIKVMVDVAYRSIKFFALELISPIAIVSYIDPSSGKKGIFSKWLNETLKTYLSLFIRIFVFSIAAVLLRTFNLSDLDSGSGLFVNLIYILAIIAFIKTAPKFIDNLFGTSISKDSDTKFASDMLRGVMGGAVAGTVGAISGAHIAGKVGQNAVKGAFTGGWSGFKKGYDSSKKGNLQGVVSSWTGAYKDNQKKYGYEIDKEREKLIDSLERKVPSVDEAKSNAINELMANDREKYNEILKKGTKVNGRMYGRGLENDEGLENLLKKNAGGLAKDLALHADDQEYIERRRLVADRKEADAIMQRTNALASAQYSDAQESYNSADNKQAYIVSFATDTAKMDYDRMDDKALKENFATELQNYQSNFVQAERQRFNFSGRDERVNLVINGSGLDKGVVSSMDDTQLSSEYERIISEQAQNNVNEQLKRYAGATSKEARMKVALDVKGNNLTYDVAGVAEDKLSDIFDKANEARIVATFGQSKTNIEFDANKISGEVKEAQGALDDYLKSGRGKKAKDIDSAYSLADSRYKAKELEKKRKEALEKEKNNNS